MTQKRCNVLYLHSHDTGRYVQPYGYPLATPRIQQLAEQGVLFRQAFCAAPTCSPSRAALLTGTWPHANGMIGLAHRGARLRDYGMHLSNVLRQYGYRTALCGIQHEASGDDRPLLGYDEVCDLRTPPGSDGWAVNDIVAGRAAEFLSTPRDRPFFLSCGFWLTHRTGQGVQWHNDGKSPLGDSRYVRPPAPLPDTPDTRRDFADFAVAAGRLDAAMGQVLDALERAGHAENTLVICTTDHGIAFPFMKCNLTDHGIGVMLIMRGPGFGGGRVVDAMVSHIDVFPTVCAAAGLALPAWVCGRPLQPLAAGSADAVHDAIFAEVTYHAASEPMRAVRTARWKYIRRFEPREGPVLSNCDDSVSKSAMMQLGWPERPQPGECLYDLAFDPNEACNRAADPVCAGVLEEMRARLIRWMSETGDPLAEGKPIVPWPGMVSNPVDDVSPQGPTVPAEPTGAPAPKGKASR